MEDQKVEKQQLSRTTKQSFEFLKKLGQGAYSSVFKVRRKADGQLYALKKVKMKNLSTKEKHNSLNEVRILASVFHSNVISYKEAFFESQNLYIVMEFADNGDLLAQINAKKKKNEVYKEEEIWSNFYQICAGLNELHKLKIIHRDLKSANIFLMKNKQVKLGDMNVSKVGDLCMTQTGTPYYASPQVWKDLPYDSKSDIWSLGCVLYQMIMLRPPYNGNDMQDLYQNVVMSTFDPIPSNYSQNLKLMIDSLLQKTPVKRPSASYILQNIQQILPPEYHSNPILKNLIKEYTKKNRKFRLRDNDRINELMKTIQFPNRKKGKKHFDSIELTSILPSPSYPKSHRTSKQESIKKSNSNIFQGQKLKFRHETMALPTVNIYLDNNKVQKRKKVHKNNFKARLEREKQNSSMIEIRRPLIVEKSPKKIQKDKDKDRFALPAIENKKINYRK